MNTTVPAGPPPGAPPVMAVPSAFRLAHARISRELTTLELEASQLTQERDDARRELEEALQEAGRLRARVEELEAEPAPAITFEDADDRRGFVLFIDGEQVGEPVTYDDFGWFGIDLTQKLILAVVRAFGGSEGSDQRG